MAFTYNITFVGAPAMEPELLDYLRMHLIPAVTDKFRQQGDACLKKVVEAGDEKPGPDEGVSIAFSIIFKKEEEAFLWRHSKLSPAIEKFHERFGERALYFITLLENLSI